MVKLNNYADVQNIMLILFAAGSTVLTQVGSVSFLDYTLADELTNVDIPFFGATSITIAVVLAMLALLYALMHNGFLMGAYNQMMQIDLILVVASLFVIPALVVSPSVQDYVTTNQGTQVVTLIITWLGFIALIRDNYSESVFAYIFS